MTQSLIISPINYLVSRLLLARLKQSVSDSVVDIQVEIDGEILTLDGNATSYFACQLLEHTAREAMRDYGLTTIESRIQVS